MFVGAKWVRLSGEELRRARTPRTPPSISASSCGTSSRRGRHRLADLTWPHVLAWQMPPEPTESNQRNRGCDLQPIHHQLRRSRRWEVEKKLRHRLDRERNCVANGTDRQSNSSSRSQGQGPSTTDKGRRPNFAEERKPPRGHNTTAAPYFASVADMNQIRPQNHHWTDRQSNRSRSPSIHLSEVEDSCCRSIAPSLRLDEAVGK